jgi:hypothetical protein
MVKIFRPKVVRVTGFSILTSPDAYKIQFQAVFFIEKS